MARGVDHVAGAVGGHCLWFSSLAAALRVTNFFVIVLFAEVASQGFLPNSHAGVVILGQIAALWS